MKILRLGAILSALLFFLLAAWYGRPAGLWNSPDETANAFWTERASRGEPLFVLDALLGLGASAIHPRSMAVAGDLLVPGSFSGLILLYGALKSIFHLPLFLFTPLFTLAAGALFGAMVARLFDRRVGYVAAALFFLHPAILYYGARGLFHNVLFVDLLVFSAACFALQKRRAVDALGGFLFGWAVFTRASEAVWALPAFLLFLPFAGAERWRRFGTALLGALLPLILFLHVNTTLYGGPFKTPYVVAPAAVETAPPSEREDALHAPPAEETYALLPFGFDAKRALRNAWSYGIKLFWWQSLVAVAGLVLWGFGSRNAPRLQKTYALAAVLVSVWLAVLYGSWMIRDRLDFESVTIGTSYARYFLPAYVAMLPLGAFALVRLADALKRPALSAAALPVIAALSVWLAVFSGDESLRAVRETLARNAEKRAWLLETLPEEAVVMTERFDKLIVPDRVRIIPLQDDGGFTAAALAAKAVPVYWYGLAPSEGEMAEMTARAKSHGLAFAPRETPFAGETMFMLVPL